MANAAAGAGAGASAAPSGAGGNPFQLATNLYCEKNNQGVTTSQATGASAVTTGGAVNAGQYLRALRLIVRTVTAGTAGTLAAAGQSDYPWNILSQVDLVNVDGSEILYSMGGYSHYICQKYNRPWLGDPATHYDAANASILSPQFTLTLMPEIRWTAGVLANTDTRSQYRFDATIDTTANWCQLGGGGYTTGPVLSIQPYMDAWAQPDANDLQGTPNQPVPPGLNLQTKRRHQIFTVNAASSDNIFQSALTGNALRNQIFVTRSGSGSVRTEIFTDPVTWQVDNRSMGKFSVDVALVQTTGGSMISERMNEFYQEYFSVKTANTGTSGGNIPTAYVPYTRENGVYVFPRFIKPGSMYGEGWLYTANSTKEIFETTTSASFSTSSTAELITDEVYPVGPVDASLTDI